MFELYFPDNKLEYIPSIISLILCIIAAGFTVKLFKRISAKELKKAKAAEERMKQLEKQEEEFEK